MEGMSGVGWRLGGDEVEIVGFWCDRRAGDGVWDDDLFDFGGELIRVGGNGSVCVVIRGKGGDEEVDSLCRTNQG